MPGIGGGFMLLTTRVAEDEYKARFVSPVGIFHCTGGRKDEGNVLLQKSLASGNQWGVRRLRRDEHIETADCWLHRSRGCLSLT